MVSGVDAADLGHRLRAQKSLTFSLSASKPSVLAWMYCSSSAFFDDGVDHRVQQRDVGAGLELQHVVAWRDRSLAARVHDDQLRTALRGP